MNKKILTIATTSLLVAGTGTAFAASGSSGNNDEGTDQKAVTSISVDEAAQIAKDKFGGQITEIEKDDEDGKIVYEADMTETEKGSLEVVINSTNGDIVKSEKDGDKEEQDENDNDDSDENEEEDENDSVDPSTVNTDIAEAKKSALLEVDGNGKVVKTELEEDDGVAEYEITVKTEKGAFYEVKINAENGNVIHTEKEDTEDEDNDEDED